MIRLFKIDLRLSCLPSKEEEKDEVYCDSVKGCDDCLTKIFNFVEHETREASNLKIEKFNIDEILDLKNRGLKDDH